MATFPAVEPVPYGASLVPPLPVPAAGQLLRAEIEGLLDDAGIEAFLTEWVAADVHTWTVVEFGVWVIPAVRGPGGRAAVVDALIPAGLVCSELEGGTVDVVAGE